MKFLFRPLWAAVSLIAAVFGIPAMLRAEEIGLSFDLPPHKVLPPPETQPAPVLPPAASLEVPPQMPASPWWPQPLPVPKYPPIGSANSQTFAELPPPPPAPVLPEAIAAQPLREPEPSETADLHKAEPSPATLDTAIALSFELAAIPLPETSDASSAEAQPVATVVAATAAIAPGVDRATREAYLFAGGSESIVAKAVGHAEGTRTKDGQRTWAYHGHVDPGNGVWNLGSFSYQHGARSPEEADELQLKRLKGQYEQLSQQANDLGLTLTLEETLNALDLANQSPRAALSHMGYMDRLAEAYSFGMSGSEAILWARTRSFLDPDTQRWNAPGLGNTTEGVTRDQERRMVAIARVLEFSPLPTPVYPVTVTAPAQEIQTVPVAADTSSTEETAAAEAPSDIGILLFGSDAEQLKAKAPAPSADSASAADNQPEDANQSDQTVRSESETDASGNSDLTSWLDIDAIAERIIRFERPEIQAVAETVEKSKSAQASSPEALKPSQSPASAVANASQPPAPTQSADEDIPYLGGQR